MSLGMSLGMAECNKYEIIAIFREICRRKNDIEITVQGTNITTKICNVKANSFSVILYPPMIADQSYHCILHSDNGKIEFTTVPLAQPEQPGGNQYTFALPTEVAIVQRRIDKRLPLKTDMPYSCRGRYKNGKNYQFQVIDISSGGCALLSHNQNIELQSKVITLKQAIIDFGDHGEVVIDLAVKNVTPVNTIPGQGIVDTWYKISCQFIFRSIAEKIKMDKLFTELLMENKKRKPI